MVGVQAGSNETLNAFANLRIVELGSWVTAPAATALLADLGATVIKVEPPKGDPSRGVFDAVGASTREVPTFTLDNRHKQSVTVDVTTVEGQEALESLLIYADVFVTNVRSDALARIGFDPEATTARHPRLIYASVTGFGRIGPQADRPSYDIGAFWARSGLSHQLSPAGHPPLNVIGAIGDHVTSLSTTTAVLAALLEREATGVGGIVETSLLRTGTWVLGWDLALQATGGRVHQASTRDDIRTPLMNSYQTSDGRWLFLMGLEVTRHFGAVCGAIGREDLLDDDRFADAATLRKNHGALITELDAVFATRTLAEWTEVLDANSIWWEPVATPAEVLADEQLIASDGFHDVVTGSGPRPMVTSPFTVFGHQPPTPAAAPTLGEHNATFDLPTPEV